MKDYTYPDLPNVYVRGANVASLDEDQKEILYHQAKYCQAMTDADIKTMGELVTEDKIYVHMSGMHQTRDEYFQDVKNGALRYFRIGIENPKIIVNGDTASVTYTAALTANAYGARGTFHMTGTHNYEKRNNLWLEGN